MIDMKTSAGSRLLCNEGQVPGLEVDVFFDPKSMANVWAFKDVKGQYRITDDSDIDDAFMMHTLHGIKKFEESRDGLHHCKLPKDCEDEVKEQDRNSKKTVSFVETMEESERRCAPQEIE